MGSWAIVGAKTWLELGVFVAFFSQNRRIFLYFSSNLAPFCGILTTAPAGLTL
jgi:hypothetical protein